MSPVGLTGPHGRLNRDVYICVRVFMCVVMCVCLGAAGGQTTWHPDVEQDVLLETKLLFPANCTYFVKRDAIRHCNYRISVEDR